MLTRPVISIAFLMTLGVGSMLPSDSPGSSTISLGDRLVIASQLYAGVQMYFGHWKGVPNLDLDKE